MEASPAVPTIGDPVSPYLPLTSGLCYPGAFVASVTSRRYFRSAVFLLDTHMGLLRPYSPALRVLMRLRRLGPPIPSWEGMQSPRRQHLLLAGHAPLGPRGSPRPSSSIRSRDVTPGHIGVLFDGVSSTSRSSLTASPRLLARQGLLLSCSPALRVLMGLRLGPSFPSSKPSWEGVHCPAANISYDKTRRPCASGIPLGFPGSPKVRGVTTVHTDVFESIYPVLFPVW